MIRPRRSVADQPHRSWYPPSGEYSSDNGFEWYGGWEDHILTLMEEELRTWATAIASVDCRVGAREKEGVWGSDKLVS